MSRSALLELPPPEAPPGAAGTFLPRWVTEVDVASPVGDLRAPDARYGAARVLVRWKRHPLGFLDLALTDGRVSAGELMGEVRARLGGTPAPAASAPRREPFVSVVIPTRERPGRLRRCLRTLLAVDYPAFEVLVVDNAPLSTDTTSVIRDLADPRVRHLIEPQPGAARARNRGRREARGEILAFLDDDVLVDADWMRGIVRGFERDPQVGCVTGLVACAQLETESQAFFDARVTWSTSCEPRLFDLERHTVKDSLYPFIPGVVGTGANFAITREVAGLVGPFDEGLGPGTPARGGEDLDFFLRVLLAGLSIAYEPEGLVWHVHRHERAALRAQLRGYGSGLAAYACKHLVNPATAREVVRRIPRGARRLTVDREPAHAALPRRLVALELLAMIGGPVAYLRGRRRSRRAWAEAGAELVAPSPLPLAMAGSR